MDYLTDEYITVICHKDINICTPIVTTSIEQKKYVVDHKHLYKKNFDTVEDATTAIDKFLKAEYDINYAKKNLKRVPFNLPIEEYIELQAAANELNENVSEFLKKAIKLRIEKEFKI